MAGFRFEFARTSKWDESLSAQATKKDASYGFPPGKRVLGRPDNQDGRAELTGRKVMGS